jgi:hypothetical protein
MNRTDYTLAVLASADGAIFTPVQVQKLFFLLDKKVPQDVGGPHFNFEPFDYGPFDSNVYQELEFLADRGQVAIDRNPNTGWRTYRPTPEGLETGKRTLQAINPTTREYVNRLSRWVRSISFAELVSAIYDHFPEMRARSVFRIT